MTSVVTIVLAVSEVFAAKKLSAGAQRALTRVQRGRLVVRGCEGDKYVLRYQRNGLPVEDVFFSSDPWAEISPEQLESHLRTLTFGAAVMGRDGHDMHLLCEEIVRLHMAPRNVPPHVLASLFHPENRFVKSWVKDNVRDRPERVIKLISLRRTLWRGNDQTLCYVAYPPAAPDVSSSTS